MKMVGGLRWRSGWDDVVPMVIWAAPLLAWGLFGGGQAALEVSVGVAAIAGGFALKHLLAARREDLAALPPVVAALTGLAVVPYSLASVLLGPVVGIGILLWVGVEPASDVPLAQRLEPATVPALAASLAVGVFLFLPGGTGGQVGLAALALSAVLALTAWIYLRSVGESREAPATS
jgi:hypothetical protein